mmetsp:Transcript_21167/g.53010  ORF Transcript_21167/g.53010 Transcript_21167/m.53010 type:complete len:619 (+) Transcript_21167:187-2043(+)
MQQQQQRQQEPDLRTESLHSDVVFGSEVFSSFNSMGCLRQGPAHLTPLSSNPPERLLPALKPTRSATPPSSEQGCTQGLRSIFDSPYHSEEPELSFNGHVREVVEAASENQQWQVVRSDALPGAKVAPDRGEALHQNSVSKVHIRPEVNVIIVPVNMDMLDYAHDLVVAVHGASADTACISHSDHSPSSGSGGDLDLGRSQPRTIVAMLTCSGALPSDDAIIQMQQMMQAAGADDVILKSGTPREIQITIALSARRVQISHRKAARRQDRQRELVQELKDKLSVQAQAGTEQADPPQGMFWQAVKHVYEGFPSMNLNLPATVGNGAQVGKLQLSEVLGHGTFGYVYSAVNTETQQVEAVKVIEKRSIVAIGDVTSVWHEMKVLRCIKHDNIVGFRGVLHGPNYICIRMEHVGSDTLFRAQKRVGGRFAPAVACGLQLQVATAVAFCHGRGIAHGDLKPENMGLIDNEVVKLLDFGSAMSTRKTYTEIEGTMPFIAPEVHECSEEKPYHAAVSDIWSCGIILLEMLGGLHKMDKLMGWSRHLTPCPRRGEELRAFFRDRSVISNTLRADIGEVDSGLRDLLNGMLQLQPSSRWTATEVLQNQWLQSGSRARPSSTDEAP